VLIADLNSLFRISDSIVGPIEDISYILETLPSYAFIDARAGDAHKLEPAAKQA
jgi:hypothetical protein